MVGSVRRFVQRFPLAVVGLATLFGTGVTTALALSEHPPRSSEETLVTRAEPRSAPLSAPKPEVDNANTGS